MTESSALDPEVKIFWIFQGEGNLVGEIKNVTDRPMDFVYIVPETKKIVTDNGFNVGTEWIKGRPYDVATHYEMTQAEGEAWNVAPTTPFMPGEKCRFVFNVPLYSSRFTVFERAVVNGKPSGEPKVLRSTEEIVPGINGTGDR